MGIDRLTSQPRLQYNEWASYIKMAKIKKQDIARMLAIEPESLSRILKGKPCSVATEKLFRMIMICELTRPNNGESRKWDNTLEQLGALTSICSLGLSSVELVKNGASRN